MTEIDYQALKAGGFIKQKQKDLFSVRIKIPQGNASSQQLKAIADLAKKYGKGTVHFTVRQGIEIPHVPPENFDLLTQSLKEVGLSLGACGTRIRVITACPGTSFCSQGVGNTIALAQKLDERFYGRDGLPHKFKIGVTGCSNSCIKPQENDTGFMAVVEPKFEETEDAKCTSCGVCLEVCRNQAIKIVEDKPRIDISKCLFKDGRCIASCPTGVITMDRKGWNVFVGGKWGKFPQLGLPLKEFVTDEEAPDLIEKIISAYTQYAEKGERLGSLINRIGIDKFKEATLHGRN